MTLVILVLLLTSAFLVYCVSLLPAYVPYQLNEQFNQLNTDAWDIGGVKNFTVADGVLNLFDSTAAVHYFVTNPKWVPPMIEPNLQGTIEITFKIATLPDRSLVVASTDSWQVYVDNGTLEIQTTDRPGRTPFLGGIVNSSWHKLVADREAGSFQVRMDGSPLFRLDDWSGTLKRIELGTAQSTVGGLNVQGELSVDSVRAELQPLVTAGQSIPEGPSLFTTISVCGQEDTRLNRL